MKIRIKFTKTGPVRYAGHLDFMRSFQKILKKSGLPAVYSAGFNPHMMMSFAAPLGVGEETLGDYADVDFAYRDRHEMSDQELCRLTDLGIENDVLPDPPSSGELVRRFNDASFEGVRAVSAVRVGLIKSSKAMALVRFAEFDLFLKDGFLPEYDEKGLDGLIGELLRGEEIVLRKKTKESEKDVNIRPFIREASARATENGAIAGTPGFERRRAIRLICAQGSSQNLKPSSFVEALSLRAGADYDPCGFRVVRLDLFDGEMRTLEALGESF